MFVARPWRHHGVLGPALLVAFLVTMLVATLLPTTLTIGADGVLIERLWNRRFVPFRSLAGIGSSVRFADAIVLHFRDGLPDLEIRTRPNDKRAQSLEARDAARERLVQAFAAYQSRDGTDAHAALLMRGSRTTTEWLESLRRPQGDAAYRVAEVPAEQLWRVAEDPSADASARVGALVTLRDSLDDEGRERARTAVAACASPKVRVVLEAAASGTPDVLAEALDMLDESEAEADSARRRVASG